MLTANVGDSVGLIIFLLFLTILLSALTELISAIRQRRNRYLEDFITETLRGSGLRVSDFYEKTLLGPDVIKGIRPAYIHSSEFVAALLAILRAKFPTEASTVVSELSDFTIDELKNFA